MRACEQHGTIETIDPTQHSQNARPTQRTLHTQSRSRSFSRSFARADTVPLVLTRSSGAVGYLSILQIYLITPLLVAFILWIPSLVLILTGNAKFWPFANTQNRFWTSLLYWQFITYPIMATISMQGTSFPFPA